MDINALRVFNSLYDLGITENEFKEVENEQEHTERTGLSINLVKKGKIIGVSHDEKHQVVIKETKCSIKPAPNSRVLFKTLITFVELPKEVYVLHQIAQYRALDTDIKYIANNLEELKDRICDRFIDEYPKELGSIYDEAYDDFDEREKNKILKGKVAEEQLKALFWLFDEDYHTFEPTEARENIAKIVKVFSRNNRRLAIIQTNANWKKQRGGFFKARRTEQIKRTTFKIITFTPRDRQYNYVCPNREVYIREYGGNSDIWLDEDLSGKITATELGVLSKRLKEGFVFLTADEYNNQKSGIRIELMSAKREEQEQQARHTLVKSIQKQFGKGKVTRQGITFTKNSVSYERIILKGRMIGEYLCQQSIILQERPDFNKIFEGYVDYLLNYEISQDIYGNSLIKGCRFTGKEIIEIGKIKVILEERKNILFINNHRIRKEDIGTTIKRAINYNSQEQYNEFVSDTSKVNLAFQKILTQGGVSFKLKIDKTNDNCLMTEKDEANILLSIPIVRKDNKNYAQIDGQEYRIRDTTALLDLGKDIERHRLQGGYLQRTIKLLYRAIEGITHKEIGELIRNGKTEHEKMMTRIKQEQEAKLKRSEEFLAHAVKLTHATRVKNGYFVKGLNCITYYVGDDLGVWTIKGGKQEKYLCIIDINSEREDKAGKNDCIAKRLLALSKDRVVAKEIYEQGDKMDSWWNEIQEPCRVVA
jgi:hypothetical protein